jgi:hypothetical protein
MTSAWNQFVECYNVFADETSSAEYKKMVQHFLEKTQLHRRQKAIFLRKSQKIYGGWQDRGATQGRQKKILTSFDKTRC